MSSSPRTAFTGVPSGAFTESGTPKYARKYSDAVSSSSSFSVRSAMAASLSATTDEQVAREPRTP